MNYIYTSCITGIVAVCLLVAPSDASAQVTLVSEDKEIAALKAQVAELEALLAQLRGTAPRSGITISPVWTGEMRNLDVGRIRVLRKSDDDTSGDAGLSIYVKSSKHGFSNITGEKASYEVYLYELIKGRKIKVESAPVDEGTFLVPQARGTVEFRANIPAVFLKARTTYQAEVHIDSSRRIDETNERDNKGVSPVWTVGE